MCTYVSLYRGVARCCSAIFVKARAAPSKEARWHGRWGSARASSRDLLPQSKKQKNTHYTHVCAHLFLSVCARAVCLLVRYTCIVYVFMVPPLIHITHT